MSKRHLTVKIIELRQDEEMPDVSLADGHLTTPL